MERRHDSLLHASLLHASLLHAGGGAPARLRNALIGGLACLCGLACQAPPDDEDPGRDARADPLEDAAAPIDDASAPADGGGMDDEDAGTAPPVDAGSGADASLLDAGGEPEWPAGRVPAFVATGHVGRTVVSCDDGRSWVADRSDDDSVRCFSGGLDCDHHSGGNTGVTYGDGFFYATFGWGAPGGIRRSADGVVWETMLSGTTFGGLAYGNGTLLAGARSVRISTDLGETFGGGIATGLNAWSVRGTAFTSAGAGRFLLIGQDGAGPDVVSSADGVAWSRPGSIPPECGSDIRGVATANGVTVMLSADGTACRSADAGESWTRVTVDSAAETRSALVSTGGTFYAWSRGAVHTSPDGERWTRQATTPADLHIEVVAHNPVTGTFAAVNAGWQRWYEDQVFYRSRDGVTWEVLDASRFEGGHPLRKMTFGWVTESETCPAP